MVRLSGYAEPIGISKSCGAMSDRTMPQNISYIGTSQLQHYVPELNGLNCVGGICPSGEP